MAYFQEDMKTPKIKKRWDLTYVGQDCKKELTLNTVYLAAWAPANSSSLSLAEAMGTLDVAPSLPFVAS